MGLSDLSGLDERLDGLGGRAGLHLDDNDNGDGSDSEGCDSDADGVGLGEKRLLLVGGFGNVRGGFLGHDLSFRLGGSHYMRRISCEDKLAKLVIVPSWGYHKVYGYARTTIVRQSR